MRNISDEAIKALYKHVMENAGSGNATVVEISETEYANLSDKEKNNGTIYFVYDDSEDSSDYSLKNPYITEISQAAYDVLPEEEKTSGRLFFITDYNSDNIIKATDIFGNMTIKGEIQSSVLPSSGTENDFYFLLDKCEGRYYKNGKWNVVR